MRETEACFGPSLEGHGPWNLLIFPSWALAHVQRGMRDCFRSLNFSVSWFVSIL